MTKRPLGHIKPIGKEHQEQVVSLFESTQKSTGGIYPPKNLIDRYYQEGRAGIREWLNNSTASKRLAFVLYNGLVVGHIAIQDLETTSAKERAYWERAFTHQPGFQSNTRFKQPPELEDLIVIKRLAVDPKWQGQGIGRYLLLESIKIIRNKPDKIPALVVLSDLTKARLLYENEGAQYIGEFKEESGEAVASYIFQETKKISPAEVSRVMREKS